MSASAEGCEQSFGGWIRLVPSGEVGADVTSGLRGDPEVAHLLVAREGEARYEGMTIALHQSGVSALGRIPATGHINTTDPLRGS